MKIVAAVMTWNEAHRIEKFCQAYQWADQILVADGGSTDQTVELAQNQPKTTVLSFPHRVQLENGHTRNPIGQHVNFLIDAATAEGADWMILDDCDCRPNYLLKQDGREILESSSQPYVYVTRIYLWGLDKHFPNLAQPATRGKWEPSLWAWKLSSGLRAKDTVAHFNPEGPIPMPSNHKAVLPPYCLIHFSWIDPQEVERKLAYYRESGLVKGMRHPVDFGGPLEQLPEWVRE